MCPASHFGFPDDLAGLFPPASHSEETEVTRNLATYLFPERDSSLRSEWHRAEVFFCNRNNLRHFISRVDTLPGSVRKHSKILNRRLKEMVAQGTDIATLAADALEQCANRGTDFLSRSVSHDVELIDSAN